jgi:hypothetical protein
MALEWKKIDEHTPRDVEMLVIAKHDYTGSWTRPVFGTLDFIEYEFMRWNGMEPTHYALINTPIE